MSVPGNCPPLKESGRKINSKQKIATDANLDSKPGVWRGWPGHPQSVGSTECSVYQASFNSKASSTADEEFDDEPPRNEAAERRWMLGG